mmetsp:Transcript_30442/g.78202  ORF Transcript_30442/g.78202 Transcript_30442/m.78202 type:complete len:225 (-) Transcript_30442:550-1224(-)
MDMSWRCSATAACTAPDTARGVDCRSSNWCERSSSDLLSMPACRSTLATSLCTIISASMASSRASPGSRPIDCRRSFRSSMYSATTSAAAASFPFSPSFSMDASMSSMAFDSIISRTCASTINSSLRFSNSASSDLAPASCVSLTMTSVVCRFFSLATIERKVTHATSTVSTHSSLWLVGTMVYVKQCTSGHTFQPAFMRRQNILRNSAHDSRGSFSANRPSPM